MNQPHSAGDRHAVPLIIPPVLAPRGWERESRAGKRTMNILWEPEAMEDLCQAERGGREQGQAGVSCAGRTEGPQGYQLSPPPPSAFPDPLPSVCFPPFLSAPWPCFSFSPPILLLSSHHSFFFVLTHFCL